MLFMKLILIGPVLWPVLTVVAFIARRGAVIHWLVFFICLIVQALLFALPFIFHSISLLEAGLQDFKYCSDGREYCDEFYQLEALQDQLVFQFLLVIWIGNIIWLMKIFFRSRL
ncbi:MAG: hypothetical protein AAGF54_08295 [Pseudomonadota bacterium]